MEKVYFFLVWIAVFDPSGQIYVPDGYQKPVTYTPEIETSGYRRPQVHHNYSKVYHQNGGYSSGYSGTKTTHNLHPVYNSQSERPTETYILNGSKIGQNSNPTRQILLYNKEKRTPKVQIYRSCPEGATGQFVYDASCHQYLNCWKGRGHVQNCSPGTLFNPKTLECDYPEKVYCISGPRETVLQEQRSYKGFKQIGCPKEFSGLIPNYTDCSKFLNCVSGIENVMDCPSGTLFDINKNICDFAHKATCFNGENKSLIRSNIDGKLDFQQKHQSYQQLRYKSEVKCPLGVMGLYPHPTDCSKFLNCGDGRTHVQSCGPGTLFNPTVKICDFPYNVRCKNSTNDGVIDYDTSSKGMTYHGSYDQENGYKSIDSYHGPVYQYPQNQFAHNGVRYTTPTNSYRTSYSTRDQNQYSRGSTNRGSQAYDSSGSYDQNQYSTRPTKSNHGTQIYQNPYQNREESRYDQNQFYGSGSTHGHSSSSTYDRNYDQGTQLYGSGNTYDHSSANTYDRNHNRGSTTQSTQLHGSGNIYGHGYHHSSAHDGNHNGGTQTYGSSSNSYGLTSNNHNGGSNLGTQTYDSFGSSNSYDPSLGSTYDRNHNRGTTSHGTSTYNSFGSSNLHGTGSGSAYDRNHNKGSTSHGTQNYNGFSPSSSYDHSSGSTYDTNRHRGFYDHSSGSTFDSNHNREPISHDTQPFDTSGSYDHSLGNTFNRGSTNRGTHTYGSSSSYDRNYQQPYNTVTTPRTHIYSSVRPYDQNQYSSGTIVPVHGTSFDQVGNRGTRTQYGYDSGTNQGPIFDPYDQSREPTQHLGNSGTGTRPSYGYHQDPQQYPLGTQNHRVTTKTNHGQTYHNPNTIDENTPNYDQVVNINHVRRTTMIPYVDTDTVPPKPRVTISGPTNDYDDYNPNQGHKYIRSTTPKLEKNWPPPFPSTDVNADYVFEYDDNEGITLEADNSINDRSNCKRGDFACSETCISRSLLCNGVKDCPDGKDENNCLESLAQFAIQKNKKLAILEKQRFDNVTIAACASLCVDNQKLRCRSFNYRKIDKTCFLTDTNEGLTGGLISYYPFDYYELITERVNCTNMYVCNNKKCIDKKKICDGHDDCGDRMDEKGCSPRDFGYSIKLTGSKNSNEGLIEVTAFGKTGFVCDDNFGLRDANVVCQELGFDMGAAEVKKNSFFVSNGSDGSFYMMDDVGCLGNETTLLDCDFSGWGVHNCLGQEAVGVVCKTPTKTCPSDYWKCDTGRECLPLAFVCDGLYDCSDNSDEGSQHCDAPTQIRLVNGTSRREGRIEIRHHGTWGTICDDDFNEDAAKVVCRQLGYKGAAVVKKDSYFGPGTGPIWLDQVFCSGNESSVEECTHWNWGEHNCDHGEDVGVICSYTNEYAEVIPSERHQSVRQRVVSQRYPERCGYRNDNIFNRNDDVHFRVVKGSIARKGDYPWQAAIRIKGKTSTSHWCGAVIIHEKFVLTAAHCLVGYSKGAYVIVAGDYNTDEDEGTEQEAYIEDFYLHEDFKKGHKMNNDIALVKLKGHGFDLGDNVQAICLPDGDVSYEDNQNCTISGFGSIESGRSAFSHDLRAGWVPLQKREICTMPHVYGGALTEGMICAGSLDEGVDSCDGDSGGPLACLDRGLYTLYGITSWGQHCGYANKPGVYVKVAHYRKWIDDRFKKYSSNS